MKLKRALTSLAALALSLVLLTALGAVPVTLAAESEEPQGDWSGYLAILREPVSDPSLPALFSFQEVKVPEVLFPLDEECGIYKADTLDDLRPMVYAGRVEVVEPDYRAELFDVTATPNDTWYKASGKGSGGLGTGPQYGLFAMDVQAAWDVGLSGDGVTVAVIDSGLNLSHRDLPEKVAPGRFFFYEEEEGGRYNLIDPATGETKAYNYYSSNLVDDDHPYRHGTMVSGIIAAHTDNGTDIAGIAPGVTLMPIRCFTNMPGRLGGYTSNLISGLEYARTHGAQIINMSWGIMEESQGLKTAIDAAYNAGCILIAAAGNDGRSITRYPAVYPNVIAVGATDQANAVCSFSQQAGDTLISAPGYGIYSLMKEDTEALGYGNGTSFSAPAVVGVAALLKEADPALTQTDLIDLLSDPDNSTPFGTDKGYNQWGGNGVINVRKLLDAMGYAGLSSVLTQEGLQVRAAVHPPQAPGSSAADQGYVILLGAYNAAGHLLQSQVVHQTQQNSYQVGGQPLTYGGWAGRFTLEDLSDVAYIQAFFLSDGADLAAPVSQVVKEL